jgi:hypothetical protein
MRTLTLQNPAGHTIEIKRNSARKIMVRHSHHDPKVFGLFRDPQAVARVIQQHGLVVDTLEVNEVLRELEREFGPRLEMKHTTHHLTEADAAMIREAIRIM